VTRNRLEVLGEDFCLELPVYAVSLECLEFHSLAFPRVLVMSVMSRWIINQLTAAACLLRNTRSTCLCSFSSAVFARLRGGRFVFGTGSSWPQDLRLRGFWPFEDESDGFESISEFSLKKSLPSDSDSGDDSNCDSWMVMVGSTALDSCVAMQASRASEDEKFALVMEFNNGLKEDLGICDETDVILTMCWLV
jgi:hypothetical protein